MLIPPPRYPANRRETAEVLILVAGLPQLRHSIPLRNQPGPNQRRDIPNHSTEISVEPYPVEFRFPGLFYDSDFHIHPECYSGYTYNTLKGAYRQDTANEMPSKLQIPANGARGLSAWLSAAVRAG